jgi:hypothetical protein
MPANIGALTALKTERRRLVPEGLAEGEELASNILHFDGHQLSDRHAALASRVVLIYVACLTQSDPAHAAWPVVLNWPIIPASSCSNV